MAMMGKSNASLSKPNFEGGHRLLQALEAQANELHLPYLRLESGVFQPEGLGLFTKLGYQRRGPFGHYQANPYSVFMEKSLPGL